MRIKVTDFQHGKMRHQHPLFDQVFLTKPPCSIRRFHERHGTTARSQNSHDEILPPARSPASSIASVMTIPLLDRLHGF